MRQEQVDRVVALMSRMAAGDASGAFELYEEFGAVIRRVVRGHLADAGMQNPEKEDLDGLTLDAVMALLAAAPSWKPDGGAMPWTWAERRLRAIARRHIGQWADELNDAHDGPAASPVVATDRGDMEHLTRAAANDATIRLLLEAFALTCSERDAQILIAVKAQGAAGDPSPANTVAFERDMKPPAVRQAAKRTRDRVLHLAATDARFAPLTARAARAVTDAERWQRAFEEEDDAPSDWLPDRAALEVRLRAHLAMRGCEWPEMAAAVVAARAFGHLDQASFADRIGLDEPSLRALEGDTGTAEPPADGDG